MRGGRKKGLKQLFGDLIPHVGAHNMTEEGGPKIGREREPAEMNRAWRASRTKRRETRSAFHIKLSIQVSASFYDSMWWKWSSENIEIKAT